MSTTDTALALPSEHQPPTLRSQIVRMEDQFAMAAPRGIEAKQLVRDALTALQQNPELAKMTMGEVTRLRAIRRTPGPAAGRARLQTRPTALAPGSTPR